LNKTGFIKQWFTLWKCFFYRR